MGGREERLLIIDLNAYVFAGLKNSERWFKGDGKLVARIRWEIVLLWRKM